MNDTGDKYALRSSSAVTVMRSVSEPSATGLRHSSVAMMSLAVHPACNKSPTLLCPSATKAFSCRRIFFCSRE